MRDNGGRESANCAATTSSASPFTSARASRQSRGEILVTGTVRDLVVGSGIEFDDRGERELKGVADLGGA